MKTSNNCKKCMRNVGNNEKICLKINHKEITVNFTWWSDIRLIDDKRLTHLKDFFETANGKNKAVCVSLARISSHVKRCTISEYWIKQITQTTFRRLLEAKAIVCDLWMYIKQDQTVSIFLHTSIYIQNYNAIRVSHFAWFFSFFFSSSQGLWFMRYWSTIACIHFNETCTIIHPLLDDNFSKQ